MKKRLSALLIAVICIAITAVSAFAYTPNEYPTLKMLYPDDVTFYGNKPNHGLGYELKTSGYVLDEFKCPSCGWWVVGWEIPLQTYVDHDVTYYHQNNNGLMFIGNYFNPNAYAVSGYLTTTNADGTLREYGSNNFECCVTRNEDIYKNLDVAVFYDEYAMHLVYSHVNPLEDWNPPYNQIWYQAINVKEGTTAYNNVSGAYNLTMFNFDNRDDYVNYNNRVINVDPFYSIYGSCGGNDGYEEGYQTGYNDGHGDGYSEGYDIGRIQGQVDHELLDGMFVDLFDGLFGSMQDFVHDLTSLGWGTLTIGALLGLLGIVLVTMLIIKIIRG